MRDINIKEADGWTRDFAIALVGRDRSQVGFDRFVPTAAPNVDVRRHVQVVRHSRLQSAQPVRRLHCALGMPRCFVRMNIEVVRERMSRIQF